MPPPGSEPFLRAICDNPADDAPRLVYADWLDEHGDPERAEFIRLQVGQARRHDEFASHRISTLLDRSAATWLRELRQFRGVGWVGEFQRGFVRAAWFERPRTFLQRASQVCQSAPIIAATIESCEDIVLQRVLDHPAVSQFESLALASFSAHQSRRLWTVIAAASRLTNLKSLVVEFAPGTQLNWRSLYEFEAEWRWAVAESPHLQRLEHFSPRAGEAYRDLAAVRRQGVPAPPREPELPPASRVSPWQILRRALGIGDG